MIQFGINSWALLQLVLKSQLVVCFKWIADHKNHKGFKDRVDSYTQYYKTIKFYISKKFHVFQIWQCLADYTWCWLESTLSMMPYSTASPGLKYFGWLMSASICPGDFPIFFTKRLTYKIYKRPVAFFHKQILCCD